MSRTLPTSTMPRRKAVSLKKRTASKSAGRCIVYISSHATSEQDLVESLLTMLFGRSVYGYPWDEPELRKRLSESDPCCVVISPAVGCEQRRMKAIWRIVQGNYPAVPAVWLAPESNNTPSFPWGDDDSVRLVVTESLNALREFVGHLAELTGIKPTVVLRGQSRMK
jgi:hypothetical protein